MPITLCNERLPVYDSSGERKGDLWCTRPLRHKGEHRFDQFIPKEKKKSARIGKTLAVWKEKT
jgi:hypothetical protein